MIILQMFIVLLIFLTICSAISTVPPIAYHPKNEKSKNHLKFEYGYEIAGPSGGQLREEQRDGVYALGRYYVLGGDANQKVEYLADNWGFHPYVEYSNIGPHSKSSTQIAHGEEAVRALHNSRLNKKNLFDNNKLQQTTLKLHRVPLDAPQPQQQQKKASKPLKVVASQHRPKELKLQPQQSQYYPPKQQELIQHQQPQQNQYYPPKPQELIQHQQPQQNQYYPPKPQELIQHQQSQQNQYYSPKQQELIQQQQLQPHYILEPPPPQPVSNQIPVYFIQSGYANPQEQDFLYPPPQNPVQTTILVPVKSNLQTQPQEYYQQPPQVYFNGNQPSALPLIYEPPPSQGIVPLQPQPQLINPPHHSTLLENIQDNIKNQLLEEQNQQKKKFENLYGTKITTKLKVKPTGSNATNDKLIESTRELVTAEDVININESLEDKDVIGPEAYYVTPKSPRLSENPIVVQDPSDNSLATAEQYRSTTQKSLEAVEVNSISIRSTEPTILVTPRPQLGSNHLAPINAAIQLQSIENQDVQPTIKTPVQPKKQNVVVEIQKSVPYYLGKFEFVQDAGKVKNVQPSNNGDGSNNFKYDLAAETAENFELGKTLLSSFDNFGGTAVSSTKEPFQEQTNNLDQNQEAGHIQYQVVPAQSLVRDSHIKPSALPSIMIQPSPTVLLPLLEPKPTILGETQTTVCDHKYHNGVTYLSKVPDTTKPVTNDVFPTSKPIGTILETYNSSPYGNYNKQALSYQTIDLHGSATRDSFGLVPPMPHQLAAPYYRPHRGVYQVPAQHYGAPKKYRHARQSFGGNLRIEYGFMPPLIPSVEIDEYGKPIDKGES